MYTDYTCADYMCADYGDREGNLGDRNFGDTFYLLGYSKRVCSLFTACSGDHHWKLYHDEYRIGLRSHEYVLRH